MSEEAVALAGQYEPGEPTADSNIAPEAEGLAHGPVPPESDFTFAEPEAPLSEADAATALPDRLTVAVLAPGSRQFLRRLAAAVVEDALSEDASGLGLILCQLGLSLAE